jgi:carbonic anhydrase/acetyltransferase-like protein (isoleucine patch superfamily)
MRVVMTIFCFFRDIIKELYLLIIQTCARLFFVSREFPSSVSIYCVLDVIPLYKGTQWHKLVMKKRSHIERWCVVNTWHGDVIMDEGASIGIGSIVIGPVRFGKKSVCSQNCFISGESHLYKDTKVNFLSQGFKVQEVVFGDNVWIGSNSVILPGIKIGDNSVIGAGSVVTKDVPSFSVAAGNPAKVIMQHDAKTGQWLRV